MKIAYILIVVAHGLIHLIGFLKSQGMMDPKELSMSISRGWGFLWLAAFLSIILYAGSCVVQPKWSWAFGFIGLVISQYLIFHYWQDAKFGSLPNLLILLVSLCSWGNWRFDQKTETLKEKLLLSSKAPPLSNPVDSLPPIVQLWLQKSGALDQPGGKNLYLTQDFKLKMTPGQKEWYSARAEQWFNTADPGFIWTLDMEMMPLVNIRGRDRFYEGRGEMLISLFSLFPMVHAVQNPKLDEGSLQRYLGETVWCPSSVLSPYIRWEAIDSTRARAIMEYKGTRGEGIFHFSPEGEFLQFTAQRYMGSDEKAEKKEWIIEAIESAEMKGIRIPVLCRATWKLDAGDWTWAEIRVREINRDYKSEQ